MVGPLEYFDKDPMYPEKNRGPGYYYYRGELGSGANLMNAVKKRGRHYWSKYDPRKDEKGPGSEFTILGEKVGHGTHRHEHDFPAEAFRYGGQYGTNWGDLKDWEELEALEKKGKRKTRGNFF